MPLRRNQHMRSPVRRRGTPALLQLGGLAVVAAAVQGVLVFAYVRAATLAGQRLPRPPGVVVARGGGAAAAARGGAEDDDYDFEPADFSIETLSIGQELSGVVTRVTNFGAFVDVGAEKEGLVPISKLADKYVSNIEDEVKVGQGVKVWVIEAGAGKLTLTKSKNKIFSGLQSTGDLSAFNKVDSEQFLDGRVVNVQNFGAFVVVEPPGVTVPKGQMWSSDACQGLVHISQISEDGFVDKIEDAVQIGQKVQVRVLSVDAAANRMSLTMKSPGSDAPKGASDVEAFTKVPDSTWLPGVVKNIVDFGAFVEATAPGGSGPAQGLLHITQIKEGYVEDPAEELEIDQEVHVRVLEVNVDTGKLSFTLLPSAESGPSPDASPDE